MVGHVFLSYGSEDRPYADRLAAELQRQGIPVWYDTRLVPGDTWEHMIEQQIMDCAVLVVVMTPAARGSPWVRREVEGAERLGKRVVPLLLAGEPFFRYSTAHYADVRNGSLPGQLVFDELAYLTGVRNRPSGASAPTGSGGPVRPRVDQSGTGNRGRVRGLSPLKTLEGLRV